MLHEIRQKTFVILSWRSEMTVEEQHAFERAQALQMVMAKSHIRQLYMIPTEVWDTAARMPYADWSDPTSRSEAYELVLTLHKLNRLCKTSSSPSPARPSS